MLDLKRVECIVEKIAKRIIAQDASEWITVHPGGKGEKADGSGMKGGTPVLIDKDTGKILGGMGGKHTGEKISEVHKGFNGPKTPKDLELRRELQAREKKHQEARKRIHEKLQQAMQRQQEQPQTEVKPKRLPKAQKPKVLTDYIKYQTNVDLSNAVDNEHGYKGYPCIFLPEANHNTAKNRELLERKLRGLEDRFTLVDNGGYGIVIMPKDESTLVHFQERFGEKKTGAKKSKSSLNTGTSKNTGTATNTGEGTVASKEKGKGKKLSPARQEAFDKFQNAIMNVKKTLSGTEPNPRDFWHGDRIDTNGYLQAMMNFQQNGINGTRGKFVSQLEGATLGPNGAVLDKSGKNIGTMIRKNGEPYIVQKEKHSHIGEEKEYYGYIWDMNGNREDYSIR